MDEARWAPSRRTAQLLPLGTAWMFLLFIFSFIKGPLRLTPNQFAAILSIVLGLHPVGVPPEGAITGSFMPVLVTARTGFFVGFILSPTTGLIYG
jgi:hypothetical protein